MRTKDEVLDALWAAARAGDKEAAAFLNMFGPWALTCPAGATAVPAPGQVSCEG